jgi:hypothetical protein
MSTRRLLAGIFSGAITGFCGWLMIGLLGHHCNTFSSRDCQLLWITAIVSLLAGISFIEILLARKKANRERLTPSQQQQGEKPFESTILWVWIRPIGQVLLMGLMASLSLVVQGAFFLAVLGVIVGVFLDGLIRAITNRLPPT